MYLAFKKWAGFQNTKLDGGINRCAVAVQALEPLRSTLSPTVPTAEVGGDILLSMLEGQGRKNKSSSDTGKNIYVELQEEHGGMGTASISAFIYHVAKVSNIQLNIYNSLDYSNQILKVTMPVFSPATVCSTRWHTSPHHLGFLGDTAV